MENSEKNCKIRLFYGVFSVVFTALVGVLFIAEAADLYYAGVAILGAQHGMYSREEVGKRLLELLAPILLWIGAIVLGAVIDARYPALSKRRGPDPTLLYSRLRGRAMEEKDPDLYANLRRMERIRLCVRLFSAAFCLLAAVMCIVYLATASHFTALDELSQNILHMVANVFPWVGAALLVLIGETVFEFLFAKRMLPLLKSLAGSVYTPSPAEKAVAQISAKFDNKYVIFSIRVAIFVLAAVFIGLGIWNGSAEGVLQKAIKICTECIGLG